MKIRVGILAIGVVVVLGGIIGTRRSVPFVSPRIIDQCPGENRPPFDKKSATIQKLNGMWTVTHPQYNFSFIFPDDGWRLEENTIQDVEEPISTPGYLYTFLLRYDPPGDSSRRAVKDVRFLVYPSWCNSPTQWAQFFVSQGWHNPTPVIFTTPGPQWTSLSREDSGRSMRMYIAHLGILQYAFVLSWDVTNDKNIHEEDLLGMVKSFQFMKGVSHETPR